MGHLVTHIRKAATAALLAWTTLPAASACAATTAANTIAVNATVSSNCVVSTTAVAFPDVDVRSGAAVDATGGLTVTCTNGTHWSATADAGSGSATGATLQHRQMSSGANLLIYSLFLDSPYSTIWGDGSGGSGMFSDTGNGMAQAKIIYARVYAGQSSLPSGNYEDTITVTVNY